MYNITHFIAFALKTFLFLERGFSTNVLFVCLSDSTAKQNEKRSSGIIALEIYQYLNTRKLYCFSKQGGGGGLWAI